MDEELIQAMTSAIESKDVTELDRLLELNPVIWGSDLSLIRECHSSGEVAFVTVLKKLAFEDFDQGLQIYINRCWPVISRVDVRAVLGWCITDAASTKCTRVLLETALECTPAYVKSRAVFLFANYFHFYDIAERAARMPRFKVENKLRVRYKNQLMSFWQLPLHDAVCHHQLAIVELLLVERGANVDGLDEGITPLVISCQLIHPNMVALLLRHGANANGPPRFCTEIQTVLAELTKEQSRLRGIVANLPMDRRTRSKTLSEKSEYIMELLIDGGLTKPNKRFIKYSAVYSLLSPATRKRLKKLNTEVRPLVKLSLLKVRQMVRRRCEGIRFSAAVDNLDIPDSVKKLITFRVRI